MPVRARKGVAGLLVHRQRGRDVEQHQALHRPGVVSRQTVRHAGAAVVRQHGKARVAQMPHHRQHFGTHDALAVEQMRGVADGFGGISVAAQVGQHQREVLRQRRGHLVPDRAGLRMAVQQQQRWAVAARQHVDVLTVGRGDAVRRKARKQVWVVHAPDGKSDASVYKWTENHFIQKSNARIDPPWTPFPTCAFLPC
ncbi:hypothetical protein D3C71_1642750 [compost metagenome]